MQDTDPIMLILEHDGVNKIANEMRNILGPWRYSEEYLDEVLSRALDKVAPVVMKLNLDDKEEK